MSIKNTNFRLQKYTKIASLILVISLVLVIAFIGINYFKQNLFEGPNQPVTELSTPTKNEITEDNPPTPSFNISTDIDSQETRVLVNLKGENDQSDQVDPSIPVTDKKGTPNTLEYPSLNITAPIIHAGLSDLFEKNPDGTINRSRQIQEDPNDQTHLSTPVQRMLTKGIVHLGFTPNPGEFGNSYIVGHSSNYPTVKSEYNTIFKDLNKAKIDDIFTIYNKNGQGMDFKVFENIVVDDEDTKTAYQDFTNRRVVTLQASVLVYINGKWLPLKRQLIRGELVNNNKL